MPETPLTPIDAENRGLQAPSESIVQAVSPLKLRPSRALTSLRKFHKSSSELP